MRIILFALLALIVSPALAADWGSYENGRFGYVVAVPPDFSGSGEADNGDGQLFTSGDGTQTLRVYGGNILEADFEADANAAIKAATSDGWAVSYERVTPSWASYSGSRQGLVLYVRSISLCAGTQFATFEFQYPKTAIRDADAVVEKLVRSLKPTGGVVSC
jgi:hypothetical protein